MKSYECVVECIFVLFDLILYISVNSFSVMLGGVKVLSKD